MKGRNFFSWYAIRLYLACVHRRRKVFLAVEIVTKNTYVRKTYGPGVRPNTQHLASIPQLAHPTKQTNIHIPGRPPVPYFPYFVPYFAENVPYFPYFSSSMPKICFSCEFQLFSSHAWQRILSAFLAISEVWISKSREHPQNGAPAHQPLKKSIFSKLAQIFHLQSRT